MENQVLTIEQMMHLQALGLDISKASMCWVKDLANEIAEGKEIDMTIGWFLDFNNPDFYKYNWFKFIPTFTLQDILEMLPYKIVASYLHISKKAALGDIWFYVEYSGHVRICDTDLLTAVYDTLCWCIENKYLDKEDTK